MIYVKKIFSERLRQIRDERGLNQTALGKAIGQSRGSIYRYEKWETKRISDSIIRDLAKELNVNIDWLLGETDTRTSFKDILYPNKDEEELLKVYRSLNKDGKKQAKIQLNNLGSVDDYKEDLLIAAHGTDENMSDEDMADLNEFVENLPEQLKDNLNSKNSN